MGKGWREPRLCFNVAEASTSYHRRKKDLVAAHLALMLWIAFFWGTHHIAGISAQNKLVFDRKGFNVYSDVYKNSTDKKLSNESYNPVKESPL